MESTVQKKVVLFFSAVHTWQYKIHVKKQLPTPEPSKAEPQDSAHLSHLPHLRAEGSWRTRVSQRKTVHTIRRLLQPPWRLDRSARRGTQPVNNTITGAQSLNKLGFSFHLLKTSLQMQLLTFPLCMQSVSQRDKS